ncbi:hypothetical protein PIGHUM_03063 [Pigmentiphaga humi]|uniref:Salt-induced outer membrane protein n=1 Tax=Pigmentiphaga humi TaxID=2478468 RepID=A0A3P4B3V8_9BURK|nr:DUF481 domain-containing protein [Pigmentiphaga humi]VCU70983.1 hypothetical protein PIGHUM_03063 [Pigmentiphaga humi]
MFHTARIAALALAVAALPVWAQAPLKTDGQWRGSVNAGASLAKGNTDSTTLNIGANAGKATETDRLNFSLTALYGTKNENGDKSETANLWRMGGKYDRDITDRMFGFGSLDLEHDKLQELDLRGVAAGGVGRHIVKTDKTLFDVFTGLAYNHERFTHDTRNSVEWLLGEESSHKISDTTSLHQRLAVYPNLSNGGEYRVQLDAGLTTSITKKIELKLTLSNRYMSNPQPGVKKTDTLLLTSIGYRFGPD